MCAYPDLQGIKLHRCDSCQEGGRANSPGRVLLGSLLRDVNELVLCYHAHRERFSPESCQFEWPLPTVDLLSRVLVTRDARTACSGRKFDVVASKVVYPL